MKEPASLEDTFSRLAGYAAKFDAGEDFVYGIFNRDETSVFGGTGLHRRIAADALEIGYWIRADQVRCGFAVEAARALTEAGLAVPGVGRIQIHCDPANVVSRRIPERLGYRLIEHRSGDKIDPRGLPRDTVVYERRDPPAGSLTKA